MNLWLEMVIAMTTQITYIVTLMVGTVATYVLAKHIVQIVNVSLEIWEMK